MIRLGSRRQYMPTTNTRTPLRGRLFLRAIVILTVTPHLRGQCTASASAAVDESAGVVNLTMSNSGNCTVGSFNWTLDNQGFMTIAACPDGEPTCTIVSSLAFCGLSDGTHTFHVSVRCGNLSTNGSCVQSTATTDATFVVNERPTSSISATRIAPG